MSAQAKHNLTRAIAQIKAALEAHPGGEVEVVIESSIGFVLTLGFDATEALDEAILERALSENTVEQVGLMDLRGAAEAGRILEIRDPNTREPLAFESGQESEGAVRFCPRCGEQALGPDLGGFVEMGEYDGGRYAVEGDAQGYRCHACGNSFLDFPISDDDRATIRAFLGELA